MKEQDCRPAKKICQTADLFFVKGNGVIKFTEDYLENIYVCSVFNP